MSFNEFKKLIKFELKRDNFLCVRCQINPLFSFAQNFIKNYLIDRNVTKFFAMCETLLIIRYFTRDSQIRFQNIREMMIRKQSLTVIAIIFVCINKFLQMLKFKQKK